MSIGMGAIMKKGYQLGLYEKSMPVTLTWSEKLTAAKDASCASLHARKM